MRKPVIGVMPLMDVERESYWMLPGYMEGILEAGGIPVMFPLTPDRAVLGQLAESCRRFSVYRRTRCIAGNLRGGNSACLRRAVSAAGRDGKSRTAGGSAG